LDRRRVEFEAHRVQLAFGQQQAGSEAAQGLRQDP
jgi:hypothetical protein